jgi:putative transcriptional regulator
MTTIFKRVRDGLTEAVAHARGESAPGLKVHVPDVLDVAAIRERVRLSQDAFAATIGVPVGTLRNWEQKRRQPEGPARVLLAMLDHNPQIVKEMLGTVARTGKNTTSKKPPDRRAATKAGSRKRAVPRREMVRS